jgi:hypothetical protein
LASAGLCVAEQVAVGVGIKPLSGAAPLVPLKLTGVVG